MRRGAGLRRTCTRWRVAVLGVVVGVVTLGGGLPAASAAPYPPTTACALSWAATPAADSRPVLIGSGLGDHTRVDVMLHPGSRSLGSYATDASGAFSTPVSLPARSDSSWLTASSGAESCSTRAPRTPSRAVTGTPAPAAPGSSAPTGSRSLGVDPTSVAAPQGNSAAQVAGRGAAAPSSGATDYPPRPYPPTTTRSTAAPGSAPASSGTGTSPASAPASPGRPSHSTPPQSLSSSSLGVPLSIILGLAVLLIVAGGAAVLILTRRAN